MDRAEIIALLEALAVGDAFAKSTEFASRSRIRASFATIDRLLLPEESLAHTDMRFAQVTDDTEQNFFLIEDYAKAGCITPEIAAASIVRWYEESPEPDKYIGPSSARAIAAIRAGESIETAGRAGTSCGGVMRAPAAFLCSGSLRALEANVHATLCPTHNTPQAMEAAMGYAWALWRMQTTDSLDAIADAAIEGCAVGWNRYGEAAERACVPRCGDRIRHLQAVWSMLATEDDVLDFLFSVYGTTISSCDVFVAAFALFMKAERDVFRGIRMAAMLGGDTDTIACLAAVLCCAHAGGHNLPPDMVRAVRMSNALDFEARADDVQVLRARTRDPERA